MNVPHCSAAPISRCVVSTFTHAHAGSKEPGFQWCTRTSYPTLLLLYCTVRYCAVMFTTVQYGAATVRTTPRCYLHTHCLQSSITALRYTALHFHTLSQSHPPSLHHPLTVENPPILYLLPSPPSSLTLQPSFLHPCPDSSPAPHSVSSRQKLSRQEKQPQRKIDGFVN